jgi:hypothetical protein
LKVNSFTRLTGDVYNQFRLDEAFKIVFMILLKNEHKDLSDENARLIIENHFGCNFSNSFDFYNIPMLRNN